MATDTVLHLLLAQQSLRQNPHWQLMPVPHFRRLLYKCLPADSTERTHSSCNFLHLRMLCNPHDMARSKSIHCFRIRALRRSCDIHNRNCMQPLDSLGKVRDSCVLYYENEIISILFLPFFNSLSLKQLPVIIRNSCAGHFQIIATQKEQ